MPPHSHEKTHFCLLLQGVYEENWGRDIFVRKPGTLALTAGGAVHSNRIHSSGIRFFSIEMTQPWLDRANGHLKYFQGLTQFDNGSLPWLAMRLYREFRCEDDVAPLAIEGLVLELLAGLARQGPESEGAATWLKKAQDFVRPIPALDLSCRSCRVRRRASRVSGTRFSANAPLHGRRLCSQVAGRIRMPETHWLTCIAGRHFSLCRLLRAEPLF